MTDSGTPPPGGKRALLARMLAERAASPRSYPVSFGQQRLWFLDRFEPGQAIYNLPVGLRLRGPLDVDALRGALAAVVARHGALRTTFADSGGEPLQVVHPTGTTALTVTDLTDLPSAERERAAARLLQRDAEEPFDLRTGPLLRARVLRLADDEHHLSICLHHIVGDAWSLGVLFAELGTAYRALAAGSAVDLPKLPAQYADYALWQRERLAGDALRDQLAYWAAELRGAPALLALPTDRPRPAVAAHLGAVHYFTFPDALTGRLHEFNRAHGVTMFMTLLAGFTALLSRYSGQDDVVIGTPVAGRGHADLEPLIGFFVNTLALRMRTTGAPGLRELVTRAREATLNGLAHADLPFEKLVEELAPQRSLGHTPIFQAQLIVQNTPPIRLDLPGVVTESLLVDSGTAKFDLSLVGDLRPDGSLLLAVEYDRTLFDEETVARLSRHLTTLLDAGTAEPDRPVGELDLLTGVERWRAVVDWNSTAQELPPVDTVLELIVDDEPATSPATATADGPTAGPQAASADGPTAGPATAAADGPATVRGPDGAVDTGELLRRVARLGHLLRVRGAAPDQPVALCLDRGVGMLVGVLGSWHAGAGYLPLDPSLPADRLRYLLADSGARVLVTSRAVRDRLGAVLDDVPTRICLDEDAAELAAAPADTPAARVHPESLAYLIYTSGSTGRPKGVAVPHRAVVNLVTAFFLDLGLTPADRFAAVTTLSFDISVLELLVPLVSGAELTIVDSAEAADGVSLRRRLDADGITAMQGTPATWRMLLAAGGVPGRVRTRLCGGEALPRDLADALLTDGATLWNCYGPTETTVWSAAAPVAPAPAAVDLGRPISNTELYVLDSAGHPVPVGVVGEVHIGGAGVVRGYHGRPGLTATRFVPDAFTGRPGARLYATGDLARQRADGRLEFLGRTDHQVKVRGFRIELGEIEELLRAHPRVGDAVVGVWSGEAGDTRLVAYVVPAAPAGPDPSPHDSVGADGGAPSSHDSVGLWPVLRDWLVQRLPGYMVPAVMVSLPALPTNTNGKLDRSALPDPDWRDGATGEPDPPGTALEAELVEIWQQVLGVPRVGVHDDFFALGGHSLLAAQALGRVGATFELDLPIRVIFEAPTPARLARELTAREPVPGQVAAIAELRREVAGMNDDELRSLLDQTGDGQDSRPTADGHPDGLS